MRETVALIARREGETKDAERPRGLFIYDRRMEQAALKQDEFFI